MPPKARKRSPDAAVSDLACTRCRERKIRCGRERPKCNTCRREGNIPCEYQNPAKRVNHLKLLCSSVERLDSRLTLMESHLARLDTLPIPSNPEDRSSRSFASVESSASPSDAGEDYDDDSHDETGNKETAQVLIRDCMDTHGRWYGTSSLYVLCNHLRVKIASRQASNAGFGFCFNTLLQPLCDADGATEPFPTPSNQPLDTLVPKQQAVTAVEHFFRNLDCITDLFDQGSFLVRLDEIYSRPLQLEDEALVTCLRTIVLLVLGKEIMAKLGNDSVGPLLRNLARSFLPSRTESVNSRLLTTPKLINVQTLILLSTATQQFDPLGWAEFLFSHASMLARTVGLHHSQIVTGDGDSVETLERAKVIRSMYCRDKSLCLHRGSISWFETRDSNVASELSNVIKRQAQYSGRIQLAMLQDDIHQLLHKPLQPKSTTAKQPTNKTKRLDQQLEQFAKSQNLFKHSPRIKACPQQLVLEFLNVRIIFLQQLVNSTRHQRLLDDCRASCCMVLIASGNLDDRLCRQYESVMNVPGERPSESAECATRERSFTNILDYFSMPAFFIFFDAIIQRSHQELTDPSNYSDLDLLRKVSACFATFVAQVHCNSYHSKIAQTFNELLLLVEVFKQDGLKSPSQTSNTAPVAQMVPCNPIHVGSATHGNDCRADEALSSTRIRPPASEPSSFTPGLSTSSSESWDTLFSPHMTPGSSAPPLTTSTATTGGMMDFADSVMLNMDPLDSWCWSQPITSDSAPPAST